ncbi:hypothetical protein I302_107816 [Kwoniella bestiolae CBS 10118]|uniref:CLASP N-terminal domain-containing protein n=1 Tax=Kwoniella bestiolae CBS 10118 TaxID=1296100 RepID=A0A1B9FXG5_9TREE|nr:hypothetical protein I302_06444 [Kwoniella bestiolae CBS 10118]OCF23462.1 hypothetical protein I302_06444 [Kwoniella bestiolae CBS 10118]
MAPALAADAKIPCPTPQHLREELDTLAWALEPEEKEDTWEKFERAIIRFSAVTRGGGYKHTELYLEGVGRSGVGKKLVKCMLSDRGRLSGVSTDLLQTFAPRLSTNLKPLVNLYLEPLIQLLGRPNKVFLKRAEKCLLTIITHCQIITILPELRRGLNDNATTCRRGSATGVEKAVKEWSVEIWTEKYLGLLEESVKKMAIDKDPEVRQTGRRVWAMFMDVWPERIDDFSAPLTPTIRRYLEIPAVNGAGPSKPKSKPVPRAAPPAIQPISATSSESSHASTNAHAAPSRPQHHRINALASRPMRPIAHHAPAPAVEAGPSRRRSPRKEPEAMPPAYETETVSDLPISNPTLSRSASNSARHQNEFAVPPTLSHHSRSVSHNVLPSSSSSIFPTTEENRYNPLSKPSRPALHTSHTAPPEIFDVPQPPRRFAPPARILRVIPSEEEGGMELGDHPFTTPSGATVLSRPQRNVNGGLGRRGNALGQAHRRVVTAPVTITEDGYFTKTPGRDLIGQRDVEQEEATKPQAFASPIPTQVVSMDSPLMPILIRSTSGDVKADNNESDIIDMKEDVYPASPLRQSNEEEEKRTVEVARKIELPDSPVKAVVELQPEAEEEDTKEVVVNEDVHPAEDDYAQREEEEDNEVRGIDKNKLQEQEGSTEVLTVPAEKEVDAMRVAEQVDTEAVPEVSHPAEDIRPASVTAKATNKKSAAPAKSASETVKPEPAPAPTKSKVAANIIRKPPVPSARTVTSRAVSAPVVRKPFKPTSLTAPTAASAARAAAISKPAPATTAVSKPSVATSTTAKAPGPSAPPTAKPHALNGSTSSKPFTAPSARARVVSAQIAPKPEPKITTKPPLPPAARAPTRVVSGPKKPVITSHVTLPPAKKEKVVRKAPLPSFRPTRGTTSGTASLKASTSSVTSVRAKVKPEMIKLPESPFKPSDLPLPPSPHEVPLPHSPLSGAVSVISSVSRNTSSKPSPLKVEVRARVRMDSIVSSPKSPIRLMASKPLSPLLTTADSDDVEGLPLPAPPVFALIDPSVGKDDKGEGVDPFVARNTPTPISKSSTDANTTEGIDLSTDTDMESSPKVTFKALSIQSNSNSNLENRDITSPSPSKSRPAYGSRSDVSTPSGKAAALLAKLEGSEKGMNLAMSFASTPERRALMVRDTNANTLSRDEGESEWDVSA